MHSVTITKPEHVEKIISCLTSRFAHPAYQHTAGEYVCEVYLVDGVCITLTSHNGAVEYVTFRPIDGRVDVSFSDCLVKLQELLA